jgi:hypothetical protein
LIVFGDPSARYTGQNDPVPLIPEMCRRCESHLVAGWCVDETCPYNEWPQCIDFEADFGADGALLDPAKAVLKRQRGP